ncbi:MAG: hypothetical protein IPJ49_17630 [Candidatus Obscuribacter sp.]|nr:hypothetical protein [Candidatus Obscuribacter sp.]
MHQDKHERSVFASRGGARKLAALSLLCLGAQLGSAAFASAVFANPVITPIDTGAVPGFLELKGDSGSANARSARSAPAKKLLRKELVTGEIFIDIYKHVLPTTPPRSAWSIVTDGLKKHGQSEVIMTIMQEPGETDDQVPVDALLYLRLLPDLAKQNKIVRGGERTALSGREFLAPQFKGLLYVPAESFNGIELPADTLAAVPVTGPELQVWELSGPSRVMARLDKAGRYYPYLTWCDRKRESVFTQEEADTVAKSSITKSVHLLAFDAGVLRQKDKCVLYLSKAAGIKLHEDLRHVPAGAAIMLSLGVPSVANALMVWNPPGASEIDAVGPAGSDATRLAGTFIELLPGLPDNEVHIVEDGFALMLTREKWDELKECLKTGAEFDLPLKGKSNAHFLLQWAE